MSLKNPLKKMSKSDLVDQSRINLTDSPDEIKSKIKKATTDSISGISYNVSSRPGITNLLHILMSIQDATRSLDHKQDQTIWSNLPPSELSQKVLDEFGHLNNSAFKELVTDILIDHLDPIRKEFLQHQKDPSLVLKAFEKGEEKAAKMAQMTLDKVYASVGL
jgi:tryptophanyl-tRNA synthetase